MKKINLWALMAMLFSISLFVGCSSDDDETNDDGDLNGLGIITVNDAKWYVENDEGYYYYYGENKLSEFYTYIKETPDFGDLGYMLSLTAPAKNELVKGFSISDYYQIFSKPVQLRPTSSQKMMTATSGWNWSCRDTLPLSTPGESNPIRQKWRR